jgi:hypothetical protein
MTVTIDALLKDGRPALADLEGASPGGGQVTSETRYRTRIVPGDVIRDGGAWMVVTEAGHNGILGMTRLALLDADGDLVTRTLVAGEVIEARTDARIDPDTLYKLIDGSYAARYVSTAPGEAGTISDAQLAAAMEEDSQASLDDSRIAGMEDLARLARRAAQALGRRGAAHVIRDIAVWPLACGDGLITVDRPGRHRACSPPAARAAFQGLTLRQALALLLATGRAQAGYLDAALARRKAAGPGQLPGREYQGHVTYTDGTRISLQCFEENHQHCPDAADGEDSGGGPLDGCRCECQGCGHPAAGNRPAGPVTLRFFGAEIQWFPPDEGMPHSPMFVMDALGLSILARQREDASYIHIDTMETAEAPLLPLAVEVDNGGEATYRGAPAA